jgi:hypothetical protein
MEVISGIISGILLLAVLVTFPLGLRRQRRALKEIAELGSQLEESTKSLKERVESLVRTEEGGEAAVLQTDKAYLAGYKEVDTKSDLRENVLVLARGGKAKFSTLATFPKESFVSFEKELSFTGKEEHLKVFKIETAHEDVEEMISKKWRRLVSPYPV